MRTPHATVAAVVGLLIVAVPTGLDSCAIAGPSVIFATTKRPPDVHQFLRGRIGVLQPTYDRKYLLEAFRILNGAAVDEREEDAPLIDSVDGDADPDPGGPSIDNWLDVRRNVKGLPPLYRLEPYKTVNQKGLQYSFDNCKVNAFATARFTLAEIVNRWQLDSPETLEWATAQDQVFANCSSAEPVIPAAPRDGMDPLLAAHRRYQIAAAYFYAGNLRKAAQMFQEIAADKTSPWHEIAPYLAARSLFRAGLLDGDREAFREAKEQVQAILADPNQSEWHDSANKLLQIWRLRVDPAGSLKELGTVLTQPGAENIRQSAIDFLYLLERHPDLAEGDDADELAAWVVSMSRASAHSAEITEAWWAKRHNPAWLMAALANGEPDNARELLAAAQKIAPDSPAYDSVAYYAIRLAKRAGRTDEARRVADRALSRKLSISSRNWILRERFELARDWTEFLRFSLRRPETGVVEYDGREQETQDGGELLPTKSAPVFDTDARHNFEMHIPLALWVDASRNPILPAHMQARIAWAGWARAVVLEKPEAARSLLQRAIELQPANAELARQFLNAHNPGEARFVAAYLTLWAPPLCPNMPAPYQPIPNLTSPRPRFADVAGRQGCWYPMSDPAAKLPSLQPIHFLTSEQRTAGEREAHAIRAAPHWQATYLLKETLAFARLHPDDPRVPHALNMAVAASHYRQTDPETGTYAKQAFDLLHRNYPKSEWAARTRYWYK